MSTFADVVIMPDTSCSGTQSLTLSEGETQTLFSPGYGLENYPDFADCTWTIVAPEGFVSFREKKKEMFSWKCSFTLYVL